MKKHMSPICCYTCWVFGYYVNIYVSISYSSLRRQKNTGFTLSFPCPRPSLKCWSHRQWKYLNFFMIFQMFLIFSELHPQARRQCICICMRIYVYHCICPGAGLCLCTCGFCAPSTSSLSTAGSSSSNDRWCWRVDSGRRRRGRSTGRGRSSFPSGGRSDVLGTLGLTCV